MSSGRSLHVVILAVLILLVLGSGGYAVAQSIPNQPVQPIQPLPTEEPDDRPGSIPTIDPDSELPTRPSVPTPTPHPARQTPVPTLESPLGVPAATSVDPEPTATAIMPNPQPNQPTLPPDTQPTPTPEPPFLPGRHNLVEITLHQCPGGVDSAGDEAAHLAACPQVAQTEEMFTAFGELADDVSGVFTWEDLDYTPGQLIFEDVEYPTPGVDIPYPANPAVFCGEQGAPHKRMDLYGAAGIRPMFSSLSNVEYTCRWFKVPVVSDTLLVYTYVCSSPPPAGADLQWHLDVCGEAYLLDPMLSDANGWRPATRTWNEWAWPDLAFGSSGTAQVTLDFYHQPEDGANVFCGGPMQRVTEANAVFTLAELPFSSPVRQYTCHAFGTSTNSTWSDDLQIPNTFWADTWYCPAGYDPASTAYQFRMACAEPAPGIDMAMIYPGGLQAVMPTSNAIPATAVFGLIGIGHYVVAPEPLPGYEAVAFCWSQGAHGEWRVDTAAYEGKFGRWNWLEGCDWYFIPTQE